MYRDTEEGITPASETQGLEGRENSFQHPKMDFQAYVSAEWPPGRQIVWTHPQSVLAEEGRLGWHHRT